MRMNKTFIFLPSNSENNFLISCARNGLNHFGTVFLSTSKLIKNILYYDNYNQIDSFYNQYIIYKIAKELPYFTNINFEDAQDINNAINTIDILKKDDTYLEIFVEQAEFQEKNKALKTVYDKYHQFLKDNKLDNEITLLNKAILKAKTIADEIIIFEEFDLNYLEQKLLNLCFKSLKKIPIREYLKTSGSYTVDTFVSSYGMENEIEYLLDYINSHNYHYEDTNLIIFDQKYLAYLNNYQNLHGIKVTCNLKKSLSDSSPFKLFDLLYKYQQKEFFSYTSLKNIFYSSYFDLTKFKELINYSDDDLKIYADLKVQFANDENIEKYKTIVSEKDYKKVYFMNQYFNNYRQIIEDYSIIYDDFDKMAKEYILNLFDTINNYKLDIDIHTIYKYLLNKTLNHNSQNINALQVMDLRQSLLNFNKHLFIVGLNAKYFPGSSVENHLLLDNDLKLFENEFTKYSYSKVDDNKKLLDAVISLYSAIGSDIHISYYDYDLEQLKQENPSSVLFEIFKKQEPNSTLEDLQKITKHIGFTDFLCSRNKNLISMYLDNKIIKPKEKENDTYCSIKLKKLLSPTALEKYFTCPYYFYLRYILGLSEEEKDDPLVLIDEASLGTMVHACMENMVNFNTKDELLAFANKMFDDYLIKKVPVSTTLIEDKRREYLRMVSNGFDNDPHNEVIKSEMYIEFSCLDLKFKGYIDRVERVDDGTYIIVDYKTYANVKNMTNDIASCLQIVLYAYGLKQNGYDVRRCEYRYLNNSRVILVDYDEFMETELLKKVQIFKKNLQEGKFNCALDTNACRYCSYSFFCKKEGDLDGKESD